MRPYLTAFFWGFAEATFFFFIPDIYLTRLAIYNRYQAFLSCLIAAVSACMGGIVMYCWGAVNGSQALTFLTYIPGIFPKLILEVQRTSLQHPFVALFTAPVYGIPYKIYAVTLGTEKVRLLIFIFVSFFARLLRFTFITGAASVLVAVMRKYTSTRIIAFAHIIIWWIVYSVYFSSQVFKYY